MRIDKRHCRYSLPYELGHRSRFLANLLSISWLGQLVYLYNNHPLWIFILCYIFLFLFLLGYGLDNGMELNVDDF